MLIMNILKFYMIEYIYNYKGDMSIWVSLDPDS
jgi:hypothetical protein